MSAALSVGAWPSSSGASLGQESEDGQSMLRAFAPSYYLMVVFLLSALLYGMLLALRVHAFPVGDRRFFWIPSVFLVGALVVASASLGSSKFGELRAGAIDPALAWTRRRLNILRGDAYVLMLLAYAALLLFA
jgi:hypothetical protein